MNIAGLKERNQNASTQLQSNSGQRITGRSDNILMYLVHHMNNGGRRDTRKSEELSVGGIHEARTVGQ